MHGVRVEGALREKQKMASNLLHGNFPSKSSVTMKTIGGGKGKRRKEKGEGMSWNGKDQIVLILLELE